MMILILGGNGSGKSAFAESLAAGLPEPRCYIATMVAETEDNYRRIEKHRRQRSGLNFRTIELPWKVDDACVDGTGTVLLEDASNLLGNGIFAHGGTKEQALTQILNLHARCGALLVVSISGLPEADYEGETASYIRDLHWLNDRLLETADQAYAMCGGCAEQIK